MNITKILTEIKGRPGFTDNVGMLLVHNGVVRGWSRKDHTPVSAVRIHHNAEKLNAICHDLEQRPGIFCILAEAVDGQLKPGDDMLFLVVAGDIREHVKPVLAELLERVKAEAVIKEEFLISGDSVSPPSGLDEPAGEE